MAILNLVLTQQIYSEETNGAHAHYREPVPLTFLTCFQMIIILVFLEHPQPATVKKDSGPITGFYTSRSLVVRTQMRVEFYTIW